MAKKTSKGYKVTRQTILMPFPPLFFQISMPRLSSLTVKLQLNHNILLQIYSYKNSNIKSTLLYILKYNNTYSLAMTRYTEKYRTSVHSRMLLLEHSNELICDK